MNRATQTLPFKQEVMKAFKTANLVKKKEKKTLSCRNNSGQTYGHADETPAWEASN